MELDRQVRIVFLIAFLTTLAGELSITPFNGQDFRFALGTSVFLFLLLLFPYVSWTISGLITALFILVFRVGLDAASFPFHGFSLTESLANHVPSSFFYFFFAVGLRILRRDDPEFIPFRLGLYISLVDFSSNIVELLIRHLLSEGVEFSPRLVAYLMIVALFRSYFILGLYNSLSIHRLRTQHIEQQKRIEQMLQVGTGLYGETLYLQKSMDHIEQITARSYDLYRRLKEMNHPELSRQALDISQQIHEVKKDSQRILAGLMNLVDRESTMEMKLSEVMDFVARANGKYAEMLHKKVRIHCLVEMDYTTTEYVPLLTLLNNLTANAVEAISEEGTITLELHGNSAETIFRVIDTGSGIHPGDMSILFEGGFTTKFNERGVAATGIGLSHVRDIVQSLNGYTRVQSRPGETIFTIVLSTYELVKKGE
ncbi:ATP-binding protein [Ammoniphilus sp. CFH 90114]|uniref:ATP-binding protein n=1 Tax=Ammoniphilus sp. CFH 90114 TaxID=2493665 RepID=UPI00100F6F6C|nr:ATP-binding protein [Ammoniphilus sp. CFH 90114]RXT07961.1 ATP-binding protein [Ammoniphilus sp. CFH 90114]